MDIKYHRILLKLSGEALAGDQKFGLNYDVINPICEAVRDAAPAARWTAPAPTISGCWAPR